MSETGFTTGGYFRRTQNQIYDDYKEAASGVYEESNFGPGSFPFQLSKIIGLREREVELLLESMVSGLSVDLAYGDFLEKMAIDRGLEKKGPQKAGGFANISFNAKDPGDAPVDLKGTYYTTADGLKYYRAITGVSQYVYHYMNISRGVQLFDGLPTPFTYLAGTGYVDSNKDGSGTAYDPSFNIVTQTFDWSNATSYPATGAAYYVGISGYLINVKDDVAADVAGTGYNVGANSLKNWHNNATLPTDAVINNPYDITGGSDWEDDEDLRPRISRTTSRNYTTESIRSVCEAIVGVRSAHVYQDVGIDKTSLSGNWDIEKSNFQAGVFITGIYSGADRDDMVSGNEYGQNFLAGAGIMGLKKITFYGRRIGVPPAIIVGLRVPPGDDYVTSGIYDTYDVNPPASNWQDLDINIKYLDIDPTEQYSLDFWCAEKSGASGASFWGTNYWEIATGDIQSGNLGNGDSYTGLLLLGGSAITTGINSAFRTYYPAAAVSIDVAVKDGYNYAQIEPEIDDKLDWVEGSGYMPIGIDYSINQATSVFLYYSVTTYLEKDTDISSTKDRIDTVIEKYVEGLLPGENVIYSQIYKGVINDSKVWRIDDLELWESGGTHSSGQDISITEREVAVFGGSTINQG